MRQRQIVSAAATTRSTLARLPPASGMRGTLDASSRKAHF